MAKKKNVIITGAAGLVGTILRQHWGDRYTLRLADIRPVENLQADEEFAQLNITDLDAFTTACQDMEVLVHLAAAQRPIFMDHCSISISSVVITVLRQRGALAANVSSLPAASMLYWVIRVQKPFLGMCLSFHRMSTAPPSVLARP